MCSEPLDSTGPIEKLRNPPVNLASLAQPKPKRAASRQYGTDTQDVQPSHHEPSSRGCLATPFITHLWDSPKDRPFRSSSRNHRQEDSQCGAQAHLFSAPFTLFCFGTLLYGFFLRRPEQRKRCFQIRLCGLASCLFNGNLQARAAQLHAQDFSQNPTA